jgi:hypothetical protein
MLVILAIFQTRYPLGVATTIQFPITKTWYFSPAISLVLGGLTASSWLAACSSGTYADASRRRDARHLSESRRRLA